MKVRLIHLPHRMGLAWFAENDRHPLISNIQKTLSDLHFYHADTHGHYDANTAEAVANFQETVNLPVTGNIDPITYCRLQPAANTELSPCTKLRAFAGLQRANIMLTKSSRQLTLFDGNNPIRQFPVAIGKVASPTPEGSFSVASKIKNPGGMLGSRWLGLNFGSYGIHGTNQPWLIGQMVSHGCIRMHNSHVEELFVLVDIGTPVIIRN